MFKVLSIDGGGIRGIFAAKFLELCEQQGIKLCEVFDLIVGTSTGGIIALAAAYEKPMASVVHLYSTHSKEIFPRKWVLSRTLSLFKSKYASEPLIKHLKSVFTAAATFDLPSCPVRIQSFNLRTGSSKVFRAGAPYNRDSQFLVWEVAAATSAAPTYFPTFDCPEKGLFVDGGVWANNPSIVALLEAFILNRRLDDISVLSIGTGEKIFRSDKARTGRWSWRRDIIDLLFQSQSTGMHHLAKELGKGTVAFYKRICPKLRDEDSPLDNPAVTTGLSLLAEQAFEDEWDDLQRRFFS